MPHILQSPMECALAEMKETNRHLHLLTQNLDGFTVDPLGGFQLGDGVPVGKRPFYADRTMGCSTADHGSTPLVFLDPSRNTWLAICWFMVNFSANEKGLLYRDTRIGGGLPVPVFPDNNDGVVCDKRVLFRGTFNKNQVFPINLFPGAFVMAKDEVLWIATEGGSAGVISVVFGFTIGAF